MRSLTAPFWEIATPGRLILAAAPVTMIMPVILRTIKDWHDLLERLKRKYETARKYVPEPVIEAQEGAQIGVIAFGSTEPAIQEACFQLAEQGIKIDFLRVRAIPFSSQVGDFIHQHERNYVVEMNRDGQLYQLLSLEYVQDALKLKSIAYTDGLPMTARFVSDAILTMEEK